MDTSKEHKIDKIIRLKAVAFDALRRLEILQNAMNEVVEAKNKALKELDGLEGDVKNRYARAKKLVG